MKHAREIYIESTKHKYEDKLQVRQAGFRQRQRGGFLSFILSFVIVICDVILCNRYVGILNQGFSLRRCN